MEKLRQRFRSEKQRSAVESGSRWPYFELMERLETGPLPISARPISLIRDRVSEDGDFDFDNEEDEPSKSQSISYILRRRTIVNRFSSERNPADQSSISWSWKKQREKAEEVEEGGERDVSFGLASEIKAVAGKLIGVENMKLEMMKETKRRRMEMEKRRNAMILRSQQKIVESIVRAFGSPKTKRMKIDP